MSAFPLSTLKSALSVVNGAEGAGGQAEAASPARGAKPRKRKPWKPQGNDHLIYQWVRFEGKSQGWVAQQLEISQPTVSRTLQRYERWQARAEPREGGRLDHAERLRAQRWLTYERNERILSSCLRIAGDVEGFVDVSKSTIERPLSSPSSEHQLRTVHSVQDRSGMVNRYLRLAFRINMEQLKLTEQDPLAPLPPLSESELEEIEVEEAAGEGEGESGGVGDVAADETPRGSAATPGGPTADFADRADEEKEATEETRIHTDVVAGVSWNSSAPSARSAVDSFSDCITDGNEEGTLPALESAAVDEVAEEENDSLTLKLHNLHNCIAAENSVSADPPCICDENRPAEKNAEDACMSAPWRRPSRLAKRRAAAARIQAPGSPTSQGPPHDS